jgi:hypothetical protein
MTQTIIFFSRTLPNPIAEELSIQGHILYEALAISEVLALAEQHPEAQIVIAADVDDERARVIGRHYPTLRLKPKSTTGDVLLELSPGGPVQ